ncbi:MAG: mediator complex subunit [Stictis urceolatum]|nr:mediator complex subunit [Stictis urceolata]
MPGLLKRSHDRIDGEGPEPSTGGDKKRQVLDSMNGDMQNQVNGNNNRTQNGITSHTDIPTPDAGLSRALDAAASSPPPELFHITANYVSLSTLVERLAQETFIELEQLINDLAEMQSHQVNGYGSSESVQIAIRKKERLFNFAGDYRAKFIKVLVLSQWSRQSEAVSKVIDINSWIVQQKELYRNATAWMGELKRLLSASKLPAPDLRTALEVLSTGKAEWYSDLGFIPPEPYTPKQMLKGLRTVNTLLTIRLNIHEDIPPEMMDFSIASGRATFRVKDEFELDLSIADEDPASQLFFIDFRFSFKPCMTNVPEGPLRAHIEYTANETLRTKSLVGCYEFLHEVVMTHKLNIMRNQAYDMARSRWSENIKVEPVRRSFVVQYWTNRPGPKSWIEIGTRKRRRKTADDSKSAGYLGLRWHRHGKEVLDHEIEIDPSRLSLETILKEVIASHTNFIFRNIKHKLKGGPVYCKGHLSIKHRAHPREPAECSLKMQLSQLLLATIIIEPISGSFAISPAAGAHSWTERELNRLRDPANDAALRLSQLRSNVSMDQAMLRARLRRWQLVPTISLNQETIRKLFGDRVQRFKFFRIPSWGKDWILAFTCGQNGDHWWAAEQQEPLRKLSITELAAEAFQPIRRALPVKMKTVPPIVFDASYASLAMVERSAAAVVSQYVDVRELTRLRLEYEQREPKKPLPKIKAADLFIHYDRNTTPLRSSEPWCNDIIRSQYVGLSRTQAMTTSIITARLRHRIPNIQEMSSRTDSAIAFHPHNGDFAFRLRTALGTPSTVELAARFARVSLLVNLIRVTKRRGLKCSQISLENISVLYPGPVSPLLRSTSNHLTASIHFPPDKSMWVSFQTGNPQIRILDFLTTALNTPGAKGYEGYDHLLVLLEKTLPLLRGLDAMERTRSPNVEIRIMPRSATCYRVRYSLSNICLGYEIRMREKAEDGVVWFADMTNERITPLSTSSSSTTESASAVGDSKSNKASSNSKAPNAKPSEPKSKPDITPDRAKDLASRQSTLLQRAWFSLTDERGDGWNGLGGGILAQVHGAEACLLRMHEAICEAIVEAEALAVDEDKGKDDKMGTSAATSTATSKSKSAPSAPAAVPAPGMTAGGGQALAKGSAQGSGGKQGQVQAKGGQSQAQAQAQAQAQGMGRGQMPGGNMQRQPSQMGQSHGQGQAKGMGVKGKQGHEVINID